MSKKTRVFKAEVQQVLDLVIHSLYSKKEIFLRELISNASDAIDRAQYLGLTDKSLIADAPNWKIDLIVDKEDKTLTITDNGIGMNEEDLDKNLGVIANSGTKAFAQALKEKQQTNIPELIGQFGVGFYAVFMVADEVRVTSRSYRPDAEAWTWISRGEDSYTLEPALKPDRGTVVEIHLKDDAVEFASAWRLEQIVKKHSGFWC